MRLAKTSTICILILFCSCQKDPDITGGDISKHFLNLEDDNRIKKNQAVIIYDGTAVNDSATYVDPPTDKYYEWKTIPDNGCVTFGGRYQNGIAVITFQCSGSYQVFASIYDSATQRMLGITDTLTIQVTAETLYPGQPINPGDILNIRIGISKMWIGQHDPDRDPPDEVSISISYSTTHEYEGNSAYNYIDIASSIGMNSYTFNFADSVLLGSYPFSNGNYSFSTVHGTLDLRAIAHGSPADLNIGWLGKTYTGKVTLVNNEQYSIEWDNSGNVKIN